MVENMLKNQTPFPDSIFSNKYVENILPLQLFGPHSKGHNHIENCPPYPHRMWHQYLDDQWPHAESNLSHYQWNIRLINSKCYFNYKFILFTMHNFRRFINKDKIEIVGQFEVQFGKKFQFLVIFVDIIKMGQNYLGKNYCKKNWNYWQIHH